MAQGEDVYDLAEQNWCHLCNEPHQPCEIDDDGIERMGLGEDED